MCRLLVDLVLAVVVSLTAVRPLGFDHVLVDAAIGVEHVTTRAVPGSDHRMMIARLRLPAG